MAQGKKISELNEVSSVTDNDEFLFVDKEGSGADSGELEEKLQKSNFQI